MSQVVQRQNFEGLVEISSEQSTMEDNSSISSGYDSPEKTGN